MGRWHAPSQRAAGSQEGTGSSEVTEGKRGKRPNTIEEPGSRASRSRTGARRRPSCPCHAAECGQAVTSHRLQAFKSTRGASRCAGEPGFVNVNPKKWGQSQAWVTPAPCQLRRSCTVTAAPRGPALPAALTCRSSRCVLVWLQPCAAGTRPAAPQRFGTSTRPPSPPPPCSIHSWQRCGGGRSHPRQPRDQLISVFAVSVIGHYSTTSKNENYGAIH